MRKPKDVATYVTRESAAQFLLALAFQMLDRPANERVKINVHYSFWNDDWVDRSKTRKSVVMQQMTTGIGGKKI